jgi:L-serine dehydratase
MDLIAYAETGAYGAPVELARMRAMSIGGGEIVIQGRPHLTPPDIYPHASFDEIAEFCQSEGIRLSDYVLRYEDPDINEFLGTVWATMKNAIAEGLETEGVLPGGLNVVRRAKQLYVNHNKVDDDVAMLNRLVCSYAFAVSEQNAGGGTIVTAPTCGACGVLPAVLKYYQERDGFSDEEILRALRTAGLIGNLVKKNASISGAECGCQAEIGTACAMAAAAAAELFDLNIDQVEGAAEMALEHFLGLTCDPVCGLVQIPCIERNAVAAMRAINACYLSDVLATSGKVSFDTVVKTMYKTGRDLLASYRETAEGGLAMMYKPE